MASPRGKPAEPEGGNWSHTCSAIMWPGPAVAAIEPSRPRADARSPLSSSYSPRSPAKIGQMRPMVVLFAQFSVGLTGWPMSQTLGAWLLHHGSVPDVARAIHVHPQTVRYRLARLRALFDLDDPEARFELLLVTRARGLGLGSWPQ